MSEPTAVQFRAGFIGLIGQPNAGKSTLMNYLVDEKVSIVTPKPQTTRRRMLGVWSSPQGQIVFVDAPGLIQAEKGLNGFLALEAEDVMKQSDALWAVVSVDEEKVENIQKTIEMVAQKKKPWIGVITKADLLPFQHRILILKDLIEKAGGKAVSISSVAKTAEAREDREILCHESLELLPTSPQPLYDPELFTPESMRTLCAEVVREKCFDHLHHEIPYNLAVRVLLFDETAHPVPHLALEIIVAKENHKGMVIGKKGQTLKMIGTEARKEIEKLMGEKVFLDLKVSCREQWFENNRVMKELGYVLNTSND